MPEGSCVKARPLAEVGPRLGRARTVGLDVSAMVPRTWTPQQMECAARHGRPSRCHRGRLWRDGILGCQAQRCSVTAQPGGRHPAPALPPYWDARIRTAAAVARGPSGWRAAWGQPCPHAPRRSLRSAVGRAVFYFGLCAAPLGSDFLHAPCRLLRRFSSSWEARNVIPPGLRQGLGASALPMARHGSPP